MTAGPDPERPAAPAVDRTITILETLVDAGDTMTLTALAKAAGIPLASAATIMQTLESRGYAARRVIGRSHYWRATLRLYSLGARLMRGLDLSGVVQPHLRRLSDQLEVPAHFGVLEGFSVVYVAKAIPPGMIQFNTYVGKVAPFDLTALGRAIAAFLGPEELSPLLAHLSSGRGPKAPAADRRRLLDRLAEIRVQRYAIEDEEEEPEIGCMAVPIFDAEHHVRGALGVTGFARDVVHERFEAVRATLQREGEALSDQLGYQA